jgi:hypothetical protein
MMGMIDGRRSVADMATLMEQQRLMPGMKRSRQSTPF